MSPSLKCRFTINTYSRDIALGSVRNAQKTLHRHFSSMFGPSRCGEMLRLTPKTRESGASRLSKMMLERVDVHQ